MIGPNDKLIGQYLGAYKIVEAIGHGGTARVYKGYHKDLDRYAAVKVIEMGLGKYEGFIQRFRREAQAIATLKHANIVTIYDFAEFEHGYYLAMEFVDGHDLEASVSIGERLSADKIESIVFDIASALDHAHLNDVIHRDVKPSNIMITPAGQAVLTDFGLVMLPNSAANTTQGNAFGTPYYMAPEQATSSAAASPASDIYSLGCIIFELLTGKPPYEADSPLGVALKHISDPIPNIQEAAPQVPDAVRDVIEKALAKDVADRFTSAGEMAVALTDAWSKKDTPPVAVSSSGPTMAPPPIITAAPPIIASAPLTLVVPPPAKRARPSRLIWGALLVLLLVVLSVGVGLSLRQPGELNQANAASASSTPLSAENRPESGSLDTVGGDDTLGTVSVPRVLSTSTTLPATTTIPLVSLPTQTPTPNSTSTQTPEPPPTSTPESPPSPTVTLLVENTPTVAEQLALLKDKILFKTNRSGRVEIYQMNADGSDQVPLDAELSHLYNEATRWEAFSPNREETVVVRGDGLFDIWRVNLALGNENQISIDPANDFDPVWSPLVGDNRIAFVSERTGRGDLYLFDLDTNGVFRLTHNEVAFEKHPSWSSDGRRLVYWSDFGGQENSQIYLLDLDTEQNINLSNNAYRNWDPVWVK